MHKFENVGFSQEEEDQRAEGCWNTNLGEEQA